MALRKRNLKMLFCFNVYCNCIVYMAAELAPPGVGKLFLIAERAKPTTETSTVARTGEERHTPTFGYNNHLITYTSQDF